jgi:hypothetical protein
MYEYSSQVIFQVSKATTQSQNQVQSRVFLDIVVGKSTAILKLLSRKNQALLIAWDAFPVLNLGFHILNRVRRLYIERNRLARKSFYLNLRHLFIQ